MVKPPESEAGWKDMIRATIVQDFSGSYSTLVVASPIPYLGDPGEQSLLLRWAKTRTAEMEDGWEHDMQYTAYLFGNRIFFLCVPNL